MSKPSKMRRKKPANLRKPMPAPSRRHKDRRRKIDLDEANKALRQFINPFGCDDE